MINLGRIKSMLTKLRTKLRKFQDTLRKWSPVDGILLWALFIYLTDMLVIVWRIKFMFEDKVEEMEPGG
jgi:hypothetical protein